MVSNAQDFLSDIETAFSDIIHRLNARVLIINNDELFIINDKIILWLPFDRDGLDMWYLEDDEHGGFRCHRLSMFLMRRSNGTIGSGLPHAVNWREIVHHGAVLYVRLLNAVGADVLAGEKKWLRDWESIGSTSIPLPQNHAEALKKALAS